MKGFLQFLLNSTQKATIFSSFEASSSLTEHDRLNYFGKIKVVVCTEKCPSCNRICGKVNHHEHHSSSGGHQMRSFKGAAIPKEGGGFEASLTRC